MSMQATSLTLLRWVLGVVVIWQSVQFIISRNSAHAISRMGLPHVTIPILGGAEIFAAVLFLLPKFSRLGGYLLLFVFAFAIVLHVLHREFGVGPLVVYAAAAFACASSKA
ncbi:MAG: DoxX family protein [Acidobacteria bacterium]|nr:DoxX family protein [Acidobacteriota bacterium]